MHQLASIHQIVINHPPSILQQSLLQSTLTRTIIWSCRGVMVRCINGATIGERKNMNLPGVIVDLPTVTEKVLAHRLRYECLSASQLGTGLLIGSVRGFQHFDSLKSYRPTKLRNAHRFRYCLPRTKMTSWASDSSTTWT